MAAFNFVTIAHAAAAVFAIIELGLIAYVASALDYWPFAYDASPPRVNFMVFNAVWSLLVLVYVGLIPLFLARVYNKHASLVLNAITSIFWFAGSIALAVFIGPPDLCVGSVCRSMQAADAFGFFLWAIFTFLAFIDGMEAFGNRGATSESTRKPGAHPGV